MKKKKPTAKEHCSFAAHGILMYQSQHTSRYIQTVAWTLVRSTFLFVIIPAAYNMLIACVCVCCCSACHTLAYTQTKA